MNLILRCISLLCLTGPAVFAQSTNQKDNDYSYQTSDSTRLLKELMVYGQKRQIASINKTLTPIIDLPISVQLIDKKLIEQQQITDIRDAIKNVSGITVTGTYGDGYAMFNGRGFGMNFNSNFRWNGILMQTIGRLYGDNIERIEVLKGPASIQYGDVAPGAVMNFVSKKPLDYDYRRFELKVGEYGFLRPTLDLSGALTSKKQLLYRLNASYESGNHFIDKINSKSYLFAPSITWKITTALEWNVEMTAKNDNRTFAPGLVSPDGTFEGLKKIPRGLFLGEPDNRHRSDELSGYSTLSYKINNNLSIRNVSYYSKAREQEEAVFFPDRKADENGNLNRTTEFFQTFTKIAGTTLDLVGKFSTFGVHHDFVIGADYTQRYYTMFYNDPVELKPFNMYRPVYGENVLPKIIGYDGDPDKPRQYITRYGLYAQDQLKMWDERIHLMLGLRFNKTVQGTKYTAANPVPANYKDDVKQPVSPRIALLIKPLKDLSVYASYTQSYEQNGWYELTNIMLQSTDAKQIEFGAKSNIFSGKLGIGLSVFQIDKKNIVGYVFGLDAAPEWPHLAYNEYYKWAMYQGGHHRSRGVELDINGKITPQLSINVATSYINATVINDPAFKTGNQLEGNAKQTFNIWANYALDKGTLKGLELGYGFFYKGKFYASTENLPDEVVKSYWSMDASIGYTYCNFFTRFNVSNFTNNIGYLARRGMYEPLWVRRSMLSIGVRF